ncbi:Hypothetical predicted protein [Olea europaea subsp. europaea]|uniref:Uncharacterized protein n=1 Tax=Olea europaea subsp. europaea TaxID=158383 RepID=A0A8S0V071_OLEEU|nr:Hypothetical predicted protein [Olea europaea subsp. europaea]
MALSSIGGDKAIGSQQDEVERLLRAQRSNEAISDGGLWMVERLGKVMLLRWSALPHCSFSFRSMWSAVEEKQRFGDFCGVGCGGPAVVMVTAPVTLNL